MSCIHCHNTTDCRWFLGVFLGLVALAGLYLAAHTEGGGFYLHGLALFAACTFWIFRLIGQSFDGGK